MSDKIVYPNTPKGVGPDGQTDLQIPSAYKVVRFECINQNGATFDISRLVTSFTITEELLSPLIVLNIRVRDNINFFEDFSLNGQEKIAIELERYSKKGTDVKKEPRRVKLRFAVKEYPNYQKTASEPNIQEYNIVAVSEFGYSSMLMRISRSIKGNPVDNIMKIFKDELDVQTDVQSICVSSFDGIITIQSPLKAIEWLRSKAFDSNGAPIFVYSNITEDRVIVKGLSDIWSKNNGVMRTYEYRQYVANKVNTVDFYEENAIRILDMKSNIKLDKLTQATQGGFASKTNVTDYASKTFTEMVFDYSKDPVVSTNKIDFKNAFNFRKNLTVGGASKGNKSLSDLADASISNISVNSQANYQGNPNSSTGPVQTNISRAKSYYANLEAVSHQILVYGNFDLNPGKKIRIKIPKAIATNQAQQFELDESMSGVYVIAVAAHSFADGVYTAKLKIIKDS